MRRLLLTVAALFALLSFGALTNSARAMTLPAPAGIAAAIADGGLVEKTAYICRRVWRCGPYGCGWRRACYWSRPVYRPYRYWGYHRPWPHRHWRRW